LGQQALQRGWVVSPDYRTLIEALASVRQDRGISQRELARRIGKPPSFVNKVELLERRLDLLEFVIIAEALGDRADKLLGLLRANLAAELRL
jgi:transcriptional regulator with XRE-family HTH domain